MATSTLPTRVTLLTKAQCGFCDDAKAILSRLAEDYLLVIETVDLDSPAGEQLARRGGVLFPPGIFLDGEPFSYGRLAERKLRRELERRELERRELERRNVKQTDWAGWAGQRGPTRPALLKRRESTR